MNEFHAKCCKTCKTRRILQLNRYLVQVFNLITANNQLKVFVASFKDFHVRELNVVKCSLLKTWCVQFHSAGIISGVLFFEIASQNTWFHLSVRRQARHEILPHALISHQ